MKGLAQHVQNSVNEQLKKQSNLKKVSPTEELPYSYEGDFTVLSYLKNLLTIKFTAYQYYYGAAHGLGLQDYALLNIENGHFYSLKDLFKKDSDYLKILGNIIRGQIEQNPDMYFPVDSYEGIKENQKFVVDKSGLKVYFELYEIGPYAIGFPEFTIPFAEVDALIDREGEFWKAFH